MSLLKDLFQYAEPDYALDAAENEWYRGEAATTIWGTWQARLTVVANQKGEIDPPLNWDTFWAMRMTEESHPLANGNDLEAYTTGTGYRAESPKQINDKARQLGNVDHCMDWLRFITRPEALKHFGRCQWLPPHEQGRTPEEAYDVVWDGYEYCSEPDLFPENEYGEALSESMHGFYMGQLVGRSRLRLGLVKKSELTNIIIAYIGGQMTLDEAAEQLYTLEQTAVDQILRENPEWNSESW